MPVLGVHYPAIFTMSARLLQILEWAGCRKMQIFLKRIFAWVTSGSLAGDNTYVQSGEAKYNAFVHGVEIIDALW